MTGLKAKKILVVMGGPSKESSISLKSGKAVLNALKRTGMMAQGLEVSDVDTSAYFRKKLKEIKPDVCFLALHGHFGEDGEAQKILSELGIPYTGSGPEASIRAFNKLLAKKIFVKNSIPTPPYSGLKRGEPLHDSLSYPLVVKPACQGSTIGVNVVKRKKELAEALKEAFNHGDMVLVEEFIKGRELTVGVLENKALAVIEIRPKQSIFDYNAKYHDPDTCYIVPAELSSDIENEIKRLGLLVHNSLGLKDFSRTDLILDEDGTPYVLEANTIPGLSERSLFPKACQACGISFEEMCCILLKHSKV